MDNTGKNTMESLFGRVVAFVLMFSTLGTFGDGFRSDTLNYVLRGDEAYVSGLKNAATTSVTIPATVVYEYTVRDSDGGTRTKVKTCNVTGIAEFAFSKSRNLQQVRLSSGLKTIEIHAFSFCTSLTSIEIPNSVTNVGYAAFAESGLTWAIVGAGVTHIGECAFQFSDPSTTPQVRFMGKPPKYTKYYTYDFGCIAFNNVIGMYLTKYKSEWEAVISSRWWYGLYMYQVNMVSTHAVTFNAMGGVGNMDSQEFEDGKKQKLAKNLFEKDGYVFQGWSSNSVERAESGIVDFIDEQEIMVDSDMTLYAVWASSRSCVVTYYPNGGYMEGRTGDVCVKQTCTAGVRNWIKTDLFKRDRFDFVGWSETPGGDVDFKPGQTFLPTRNMDLYAVWRPPCDFIVRLHGNGRRTPDGKKTYDQRFRINEPQKIAKCPFTSGKNRCVGWFFENPSGGLFGDPLPASKIYPKESELCITQELLEKLEKDHAVQEVDGVKIARLQSAWTTSLSVNFYTTKEGEPYASKLVDDVGSENLNLRDHVFWRCDSDPTARHKSGESIEVDPGKDYHLLFEVETGYEHLVSLGENEKDVSIGNGGLGDDPLTRGKDSECDQRVLLRKAIGPWRYVRFHGIPSEDQVPEGTPGFDNSRVEVSLWPAKGRAAVGDEMKVPADKWIQLPLGEYIVIFNYIDRYIDRTWKLKTDTGGRTLMLTDDSKYWNEMTDEYMPVPPKKTYTVRYNAVLDGASVMDGNEDKGKTWEQAYRAFESEKSQTGYEAIVYRLPTAAPSRLWCKFKGWFLADGTEVTAPWKFRCDIEVFAKWEDEFTGEVIDASTTSSASYSVESGTLVAVEPNGANALAITEEATEIGDWAVGGQKDVLAVHVPDGVTRIGDYAFYGDVSLQSARLPDTLVSVGCDAFAGCDPALYDIASVPGALLVDGWAVGHFADTNAIDLTGARGVADYAFADWDGLESVFVPSNITRIGTGAFAGCSNLTDIVFGGDAPTLGEGALDEGLSNCVIHVSRSSSGWDTEIPGTWNGMRIEYIPEPTTITFDANGGKVAEPRRTVEKGEAIGKLPTPTKTGYAFAGWWTAASGGTQISASTTVTGNVTYYAQWRVNQYTVTFNANGGTGGKTVTQNYGTALVAPTVTRTGYTLTGWSPSVPSTMPAGNQTYTAQWKANQYTATFNANGGTGGKTVTQDCGSSLVAPTVTRTGYTLTGWSPAVPSTVPASNATYTAQWKINQYTVTFNANGGTGGKTVTQNYGTALTAPTVTREWFNFAGWSPSVPSTVPAANKTYTAQWQRYGDSISASKMGSKTMKQLYPSDYARMTTVVLEEGITELPAGFFSGCDNVTSVTLPSTLREFGIDDLPSKIRASLAYDAKGFMVYGNWILDYKNREAATVAIPNGIVGIGRGAFESSGLKSVTIPDSVTSIGYEAFYDCSGLADVYCHADPAALTWGYATSDFKGGKKTKIHVSVAQLSAYKSKFGSKVRATFVGDLDSFLTVTFGANGGKVAESRRTVEKGTAVGTLPKATRKGYKLKGWYTKKSGGTKIKATTKIKKNVTYYAQWTANKYKIKFNKNGGKGSMKTLSATYGKTVKLTANAFKRSKYKFAGWAKKKSGKVVYKNKAKVKNLTATNGKTVTLYAVWKKAKASSVKAEANVSAGAKSAKSVSSSSSVPSVTSWAVGTFYGGDEDALSTITVSKAGKVSGKVLFAGGGKWTIVGTASGQRIEAVVTDAGGNSAEVVFAIIKKEDGGCRIESEDGTISAEN